MAGTQAPKKRTSLRLAQVPDLTSSAEASLVALLPSLKSVFAFVLICKRQVGHSVKTFESYQVLGDHEYTQDRKNFLKVY